MHGFRFYFIPLSGFFSPFPHGTSSLSVSGEYLALEDGPPRFTLDFSCPALLRYALTPSLGFGYRTITLYGLAFQLGSPTNPRTLYCAPYNPCQDYSKQVWAFPSSLALLRESLRFLFLEVLRYFNSLRLLTIRCTPRGVGFPIQKSPGHRSLGTSPKLIAAIQRLSSPATAKASTVHS